MLIIFWFTTKIMIFEVDFSPISVGYLTKKKTAPAPGDYAAMGIVQMSILFT